MPVEFDEQNTSSPSTSISHSVEEKLQQPIPQRGIIGWMLKKRIIKSEFQGTLVLMCVSITCFGLMFFFLFTYVL